MRLSITSLRPPDSLDGSPNVWLLWIFLCLTSILEGQVTFEVANTLLTSTTRSGTPIGIVDMNGDGLDDVLRLHEGKSLIISYQATPNVPFQELHIGDIGDLPQWSICAGDLNNDGTTDLFIGGLEEGAMVLRSGEEGYQRVYLPMSDFYIQGSNMQDINIDGWLDIFACNDNGLNQIWGNTLGSLEPVEWIDFSTTPVSDNSGNYSAIWEDFDGDGNHDLYVAKCREGVKDPLDPRRINTLYLHTGDDQRYVESGWSAGLAIGDQSWSVDAGDYDNDGDYDILITNHMTPSMLLSNQGDGLFLDVASQAGIEILGTPLQGMFCDLDNDGFLDIIVAGTLNYYYHNLGDGTFMEVRDAFERPSFSSMALGDLNQDGYVDFITSHAELVNKIPPMKDRVLLSNGGQNHFIKIVLHGDLSNRAAIGSHLEIYGDWGCQKRTVRSGASYGIMNSMIQHFGLGPSTRVDSLLIIWPSGLVDRYHNLEADHQYLAQEGRCIKPMFRHRRLYSSEGMCKGDSVILAGPADVAQYDWSNGSTDSLLVIKSDQYVQLRTTNSNGCYQLAYPEYLDFDPMFEAEIEVIGDTLNCHGAQVLLEAYPDGDFKWSNGAVEKSIIVSKEGPYQVTVQGPCRSSVSKPVNMRFRDLSKEIMGDTVFPGESAHLFVAGDSVTWFSDSTRSMAIGTGNTLTTDPLDSTTSFFVDLVAAAGERSLISGLSVDSVTITDDDHLSDIAGRQLFHVYHPFVLRSVQIGADDPSTREIVLRNNRDVIIHRKTVTLNSGMQIVDLNWKIGVGERYQLATNEGHNISEYGRLSPELWQTARVQYPIIEPGVLEIIGTNVGLDSYFYFFNWDIALIADTCEAHNVEVKAVVDQSTRSNILEGSHIKVFPNPFSNEISIDLEKSDLHWSQVKFVDVIGRVLLDIQVGRGQRYQLNVARCPSGTYVLALVSGDHVQTYRMIKH